MRTTEQTEGYKHFNLRMSAVIDSVAVARPHSIGRELMASRVNQGPRGSVKAGRFEALLDKLVAVQMDLEPVCGVGTERAQLVASRDAIAEACQVLRSAIADVRDIIHQVDGVMDLPETMPASH
jgi:hypothetical protein